MNLELIVKIIGGILGLYFIYALLNAIQGYYQDWKEKKEVKND